MLKEQGIVIAYHQGIATIKCQRQGGCSTCTAKNSCGSAVLAELTGEKNLKGSHVFQIPSLMPLQIGQRVEIGLPEKVFLLTSVLLYAVPLCALLISTLLSSLLFQQELICALFIFLCTGLSFGLVRILSKKIERHPNYQAVLLRIF